ncbi:hypothetical protein GOBAR_DD29813 [Gossypium barbadense]|nr:hypothetical protein GOBAR_DD29813 [Gossypium barbadense]
MIVTSTFLKNTSPPQHLEPHQDLIPLIGGSVLIIYTELAIRGHFNLIRVELSKAIKRVTVILTVATKRIVVVTEKETGLDLVVARFHIPLHPFLYFGINEYGVVPGLHPQTVARQQGYGGSVQSLEVGTLSYVGEPYYY